MRRPGGSSWRRSLPCVNVWPSSAIPAANRFSMLKLATRRVPRGGGATRRVVGRAPAHAGRVARLRADLVLGEVEADRAERVVHRVEEVGIDACGGGRLPRRVGRVDVRGARVLGGVDQGRRADGVGGGGNEFALGARRRNSSPNLLSRRSRRCRPPVARASPRGSRSRSACRSPRRLRRRRAGRSSPGQAALLLAAEHRRPAAGFDVVRPKSSVTLPLTVTVWPTWLAAR